MDERRNYMTTSKSDKEVGHEVEIQAIQDPDMSGAGRFHFVFPAKPDKPESARALKAVITGGIWISKDHPIPDRLLINLK
jgi:hypothetical protein